MVMIIYYIAPQDIKDATWKIFFPNIGCTQYTFL